jgi:hypothetical protein
MLHVQIVNPYLDLPIREAFERLAQRLGDALVTATDL